MAWNRWSLHSSMSVRWDSMRKWNQCPWHGVASILQTGYSVYLAEGRLEATGSPAWRWRGRGGGCSFIAVCGECLLLFLRNLWTDSFKENIQKVRNAVWLWYWVLAQVGASSYEWHKGLNLWGEDRVEHCSSVWRKEWFLKSQRCWGLTGFKDFFQIQKSMLRLRLC